MDLFCYTLPGWEPRIRPASPKRDWMEATPERFAYRCLPLAIANAHGWEILSPCGFAARWNGGAGVEDVEIKLDRGTDPQRAPVALFGQAVLTFHVEGIMRTPEGWNLWVGGPPNGAKDGIAPLGGVIETDWSPYTFTMNWRFTRANHWVRFEEHEPFCFFFPVERGRLDGVEPKLRPLAEAPELKAGFESWSKSRNAFQQWVRDTKPQAPADRWQKLYYRGVRPDGAAGPADHETKLRLAPFALPDGGVLETGACPVPKPPPAPSAILAASPPHSRPVDALGLELALRRIGFQASAQAAEPEPASSEIPGRRLEWLLDTMERQWALSARAGGVPRVRDLSSQDFLDEYYAPGRPVVIEGAMDDWPALTRWTPDYLRERAGKAAVDGKAGRVTSVPGPLEEDLGHLDAYLTHAHGTMWSGPAGSFIPLHPELRNQLLAQIAGRNRVVLLPPSEGPRLQRRRDLFGDLDDIEDESLLHRYPAAREARRFIVELGPGDLLYVPIGWWHQAQSLEFGVRLTYANFLWPNAGHETYPTDAG